MLMGKMMYENIEACPRKVMALDLLIKLRTESTNDKPSGRPVQTQYDIAGNLLLAMFVYEKYSIQSLPLQKDRSYLANSIGMFSLRNSDMGQLILGTPFPKVAVPYSLVPSRRDITLSRGS